MGRVFFTADTHFNHAAILRMCARPFSSIEEHDQALVDNWNAVVAPSDQVFVVGDFAHKADPEKIRKIFHRLRGAKHLVIGNHDSQIVRELPWSTVADRMKLTVGGQKIVLDHYPMRSWQGSNSGAIQLYGHVHNRLETWPNSTDVGVDAWNFKPVALPEIRARLDAALPHVLEEEILSEPGEVSLDDEETAGNGFKI